uniref:Uncharacterized protein n=1 Tax=Meloidogyne hapla TaxID=6305 RepID=A0A1I8BVF5_MELHA
MTFHLFHISTFLLLVVNINSGGVKKLINRANKNLDDKIGEMQIFMKEKPKGNIKMEDVKTSKYKTAVVENLFKAYEKCVKKEEKGEIVKTCKNIIEKIQEFLKNNHLTYKKEFIYNSSGSIINKSFNKSLSEDFSKNKGKKVKDIKDNVNVIEDAVNDLHNKIYAILIQISILLQGKPEETIIKMNENDFQIPGIVYSHLDKTIYRSFHKPSTGNESLNEKIKYWVKKIKSWMQIED